MAIRLTIDERRLLLELLNREIWDLCTRLNPEQWPSSDREAIERQLVETVSVRRKIAAPLSERLEPLGRVIDSSGAKISSKELLEAMRQ